MNRIVVSIAVTGLCVLLIGCGGPTISSEKWHATSAKTEADLTAAFGSGSPADEAVRKTVITDDELPENTRVLQWPDPKEPGVYYLAAIVDGKVVKQIKWHSEDK